MHIGAGWFSGDVRDCAPGPEMEATTLLTHRFRYEKPVLSGQGLSHGQAGEEQSSIAGARAQPRQPPKQRAQNDRLRGSKPALAREKGGPAELGKARAQCRTAWARTGLPHTPTPCAALISRPPFTGPGGRGPACERQLDHEVQGPGLFQQAPAVHGMSYGDQSLGPLGRGLAP